MNKSYNIRIAIDLANDGAGGGPYTCTLRLVESELNQNYEFIIINYDNTLGKWISIKRILNLRNQILKAQPDIVHYTGLQLSGFHMAVACLLAGKRKTIVSVHGFSGEAIYFNKIKKFFVTFLFEPLTLLLSSKVVGVSQYVHSRPLIKTFARNKSNFIYNLPPLPNKLCEPLKLREKYNWNNNEIIIVTVARITKDKGYEVLTDAILKFESLETIRFVIVGDGEYLEEMKVRLQEYTKTKQVIFLGYQKNVQSILNESDIFILPTLHETLSVALLEASSSGLALLGSNTGGVPEIIEDNINGFLLEVGNSMDIIEKIQFFSKNRDCIKKFGTEAQRKISQKFNSSNIVKDWTKLYESLIK